MVDEKKTPASLLQAMYDDIAATEDLTDGDLAKQVGGAGTVAIGSPSPVSTGGMGKLPERFDSQGAVIQNQENGDLYSLSTLHLAAPSQYAGELQNEDNTALTEAKSLLSHINELCQSDGSQEVIQAGLNALQNEVTMLKTVAAGNENAAHSYQEVGGNISSDIGGVAGSVIGGIVGVESGLFGGAADAMAGIESTDQAAISVMTNMNGNMVHNVATTLMQDGFSQAATNAALSELGLTQQEE